MDGLELASQNFGFDEARRIIAGYCFSEVAEAFTPPPEAYGELQKPLIRARYGYRTYDCARSQEDGLGILDLLAPVALNVTQGYGVPLMARLMAVAPDVSAAIAQIPEAFRFWHLSPEEVSPTGTPEPDTNSWWLHRAWYLVESVPGVGMTITHKILHHRWPHLFPLVDERTLKFLGAAYWVTTLEDLQRHSAEFDELEEWFAGLAAHRGGVHLTRLRLYDILLWCRATGDADAAGAAGDAYV